MIQEALRIAKEALIKPFEGYHRKLPDGSCKAYPDPGTGAEPWTIGWGSTGKDINPDTVWTQDYAEERLNQEVNHFVKLALQMSPVLANAEPSKLAAITSFVYNCGPGNYRISTLRRRVNEQNWEEARKEILKWNKAAGRVLKGLTIRRTAESRLL